MSGDLHRVLVTGGLGFVGTKLCEQLLGSGRSVLCVDDLRGTYAPTTGSAAAARLRDLGAEVLIADAATVELRDVGAVIHLAGLPGVRTRRSRRVIREANVALTSRLLRRAAAVGARFLLGSTSSVYGDAARLPTPEHQPVAPLSEYARSKLAAEDAVRDAATLGADALVVRMFTVYGPGQRPDMAFARWIRALMAQRPLPWFAPAGAARDFTFVDDAVAGLIAALERGRPGEAYNISGGRAVPLGDALRMLEHELGSAVVRRHPARVVRRVSPTAEAAVTAGCGRKSAAELGYAPRVELLTGLRLQVEAAIS